MPHLHLHLGTRLKSAWARTKTSVQSLLHRNDRNDRHSLHDRAEDLEEAIEDDSDDDDSIHSSEAWSGDALRRVMSGERRERQKWDDTKKKRRNRSRRRLWGM
ncbi:hypothetical protein EDC01DRAFT_778020 [Geopyxis carbonaria]|nr:hypothetical protein EDC01DRAFT_778020 [Geopyxis carbonaria]